MTNRVTIVEVGPRDGLQNEAARVPTADKVAFVERLADAGLPVVEVSSFVRPDRVPQLADARDVFATMAPRPGTRYTALVPNLTGLREAQAAGLTEVAIFAAASEAFSQRNTNRSIAQSLVAFEEVCRTARDAGIRVRGYVSTAFGCPFEGAVDPARVATLSKQLVDLGCFEIAVSDTIGIAHPGQVPVVVDAVASLVPRAQIALHFHDTRGQALANVMAALPLGIRTFDASAGGLGGCPFAPGATGNLATEDLVYLLDGLGYETGVSLAGVIAASAGIEAAVGHALPSRMYQAIRRTKA
jgi:isopropylmalate/homocitrate/citramalate synthase